MRARPPRSLVELLEGLGLATGPQIQRVAGRVRRLARDLPLFESVWVDALAQARILTAYQAAEINAGRAEALAVGPYVLAEPLGAPSYAAFFRARRREAGEPVRLALAEAEPRAARHWVGLLRGLAATTGPIDVESLAPIRDAGLDAQRVWAVCRDVDGQTASQWMVHNGRLPPEAVVEIARQMLAGLVALERAGGCHGDLSASSLVLADDGSVTLPMPGLRGVLRPQEGCAQADLPPDAYDGLAPERIAGSGPATVAADVYACGCLWWRLLTGRAPVPGATSLARLRAIQTHRIADVKTLAPETPNELASVIAACVQKDPGRRPATFLQISARLGPPTHSGRAALARSVACRGRRSSALTASLKTIRRSHQVPLWLAAAAGLLVAAVALVWSIRNAAIQPPPASIRADAGPLVPLERDPSGVAQPLESGAGPETAGCPRASADDGPAAAQDPEGLAALPGSAPSHAPRARETGPPADLVLPADKPLALTVLDLQPGQRVTGPAGHRPTVLVPSAGLTVRAENVRFENVDFLRRHAVPTGRSAESAAVLDLRAGRAEFHGCSFRSDGQPSNPPAAIRWTHPADRREVEITLPSGRVEMSRCVLAGVDAAVECRTVGARAVRMANTLHLGPGPLVRLDHVPAGDEPLTLSFARTTVRGARAVLEVQCDRAERQPGRISIDTAECVLAPEDQGGLLIFQGGQPSEALLAAVQWTGQGSLVALDAPVAVWINSAGRGVVLDDVGLSIAGLVRSRVEFAGRSDQGPAASRITRWQAPLHSANPPGADPDALPAPEPAAPVGGAAPAPR